MSVSSPRPSRPPPPPRLRLLVGPQLRSCVFSVACRTSTASSWVQCGVPDPNRAGPQPGARELSVACRTSTAIPRVQCGVPDPNRDHASSVWRAWAWLTKWKIFYAEGPAYLRELTDKLEAKGASTLERLQNVWLSAIFLTSYSAFGFNRLSAERSVGIRDGWTLWRSTDMFDAFCLSYWYVDRWYPDMIWHVWCRECF